jgi:hypothetical protein
MDSESGVMCAELIRDFLECFRMDYTLQIFVPECNLQADNKMRDTIAAKYGLKQEQEQPKKPLLFQILQILQEHAGLEPLKEPIVPNLPPPPDFTSMNKENVAREVKPQPEMPTKISMPGIMEEARKKIEEKKEPESFPRSPPQKPAEKMQPIREPDKVVNMPAPVPAVIPAKKMPEPLPPLKQASKLPPIQPQKLPEPIEEVAKKEEPKVVEEEVKKIDDILEPSNVELDIQPKEENVQMVEEPSPPSPEKPEAKSPQEIKKEEAEEITEEIVGGDSDKEIVNEEPAGKSQRQFTDSGAFGASASLGVDPSVDSLALEEYDYVEPVEKTSQ